jgi:hypothetical protein
VAASNAPARQDPTSPVGTREPRDDRTQSRQTWLGAAAVLGLALLARLPGDLHQLLDTDESAIATMAMTINRGGVLYRDVIDRKPPLPAFVYAGSFFLSGNRDLRPLHVVAALCLGASALLLAWGASRAGGHRAGWWAGGLLIASTTALQPHDAQAANFAHLALLPGCAAIVLARVGTRRSAILAGLFIGLATLTRQTWIIGVVPASFAAWNFGSRRWSQVGLVLGAATLTIASIALVVPFGSFWHWTFSGNGSVLAVGESIEVGDRAGIVIELFVLANVALCWLVARRGWRRTDVDLWLWIATGLIAFAAGFRFFGHYWLQVLPPLCVLAGLGAASCSVPRRRTLAIVVAVPALAAWSYAMVKPPEIGAGVIPQLAEYTSTHTRPGDLVTVWGNASDLYWRSGRLPGGSLISTDFIVGKTAGRHDGPARLADATPGALGTFLASLRAHPPVLFFDTSTGHLRGYHAYPLARIPAVKQYVEANYTAVAKVRGVTIYRRRQSRKR